MSAAAILVPLAIGFAGAVVVTPLSIWIAKRNGVVARPVKDRWSRREVPVLGGVGIFVAFLLAYFLSGTAGVAALPILAGGALLFLLGLVDDIVRLRPATKLVGQIVAASILVAAGVEARFVSNPLFTIPVTIVWVVGITNAFNLIDNMDGLCAGVGMIAAAALGVYALRFDTESYREVARIAFALAGAQAGFLVFNVNPARTFMGDSGALFIGFTLSSAAILGTYEHAGNLFLILAVPVFVLGVPIFDTTFVTVMRKFHRRKISQGGKDHLSHRLVALGMSERKAVFVLWAICASLAGLGVAASYLGLFTSLVLMGAAIVAVVIFAIFLGEAAIYRKVEGSGGEAGAKGEEMRKTFLNYLRGTTVVTLDVVLVTLAYLAAYLIRWEGKIPAFDRERLLESLPVVIIGKSVFFHIFRLYQGVWRYFGVRDLLAVLAAVLSGAVATMLLLLLLYRFEGYSRILFLVDAMVLFLLMAGSRFLFRALLESRRFPGNGTRVLVVGAGDEGEICARSLKVREGGEFRPLGFLDDDRRLRGKKILGVPVLGTLADLEDCVEKTDAAEVVIASRYPEDVVADLRRRCRKLGIRILLSPCLRDYEEL